MIGSTGSPSVDATNDFSRNLPDKSSVGLRRYPLTRETVPTAFVTPRTVQVNVQPSYKRGSVADSGRSQIPESRSTGAVLRPESFASLGICSVDSPSTSGIESLRSINKLTSNDSLDEYQVRWSSSNLSTIADQWTAGVGVASSDDRLDSLEQRLRRLEARLTVDGGGGALDSGHPTAPGPRRELSCSCSSLAVPSFHGGVSAAHHPPLQACSCLGVSVGRMNSARGGDRIASLSDKVKQLQTQLDGERMMRSNLVKQNSKELVWKVDENETLKSRVKELEAENLMWKERARVKPEHSVRELERLRETVEALEQKLAGIQQQQRGRSPPPVVLGAEPSPDRYVPIHKYRLLKAKSKKLLADKCEVLRNESLVKESLRVQLMLQNKELSELRRRVYEAKSSSNCDCDARGRNEAVRAELLHLLDSCAFAASCLLGVCRDVAAKKRPDYDQILGLKTFDGCHSPPVSSLDNVTAITAMDPGAFQDRLLTGARTVLDRLTRVQRLVVDYYTDQLVDSIDCRLQ